MSISTFAELKTAVAAWQNKTNLTAYLADFVRLAESKINRRLRVNGMETVLASTAIASGVIARPAGMVAIKALWATGSEQRTLEPKTLEYIARQEASDSVPQFFAWSGANLAFYPTGGSVAGVYYTAVPALSDAAPTNWLLTATPDLYLWACLEQACVYLKNDTDEAKFRALADGLIEELNNINIGSQFSGGPLVARAR